MTPRPGPLHRSRRPYALWGVPALLLAGATFATSARAGELVTNGSFEDGTTGWTLTNGTAGDSPLPVTAWDTQDADGAVTFVFNGGDLTPSATLSQGISIDATSCTASILAGRVGVSTPNSGIALRITNAAGTVLLDEPIATGELPLDAAGRPVLYPYSFDFTASVGDATLEIIDISTDTDGVDPLFDAVSVTCAAPLTLSRTPWQMHDGNEPYGLISTSSNLVSLAGYPTTFFGDLGAFDASHGVPDDADAGWGPAPLTPVATDPGALYYFPGTSDVPTDACKQYGDFTYFETWLTVPADLPLTRVEARYYNIDDGAVIWVFNSAYPDGVRIDSTHRRFAAATGNDLGLTYHLSDDFSTYIAPGECNRVVIEHIDMCATNSFIGPVLLEVNGTAVTEGLPEGTCSVDADSDGDGVPNGDDLCPDEDATGYDANGDGCIDDTDDDGTPDNIDAFPDDPTEDTDTDGDGIGDNTDAFPDDPAESSDADGDGIGDNADACFGYPNDDTDADGVCDSDDICPTDATDTDDDGDGVCDVEDICVGPDNVDTDGDQVCDSIDLCLGNDATGDYDADAICDGTDNCPTDANADQADADGDGIGDVCEADSDGDSVIDDNDNCIDVDNADQSDLDLDGAGDACDDDDDDDGVLDELDNCPLYANADQTDTDGDGYGDPCDGDDDGDGVSDELDACPGTPLDSPFDEDGCSGEQRIELECGDPTAFNGWARGRYVRCVVRESRAAYRAGLITKRERAWIIKRAVFALWLARWRSRLRRWC